MTPSDNYFTISPHNLALLHSTLLHSYPVPLNDSAVTLTYKGNSTGFQSCWLDCYHYIWLHYILCQWEQVALYSSPLVTSRDPPSSSQWAMWCLSNNLPKYHDSYHNYRPGNSGFTCIMEWHGCQVEYFVFTKTSVIYVHVLEQLFHRWMGGGGGGGQGTCPSPIGDDLIIFACEDLWPPPPPPPPCSYSPLPLALIQSINKEHPFNFTYFVFIHFFFTEIWRNFTYLSPFDGHEDPIS